MLFNPGQSPPQVTRAHLSLLGSKYIFFLGPASSKAGTGLPALIASAILSGSSSTRTLSLSSLKISMLVPFNSLMIGESILGSPSESIHVSISMVHVSCMSCISILVLPCLILSFLNRVEFQGSFAQNVVEMKRSNQFPGFVYCRQYGYLVLLHNI